MNKDLEIAKKTVNTQIQALKKLHASFKNSSQFSKAVNLLSKMKGKCLVVGVGKSYIVSLKVSATLSSLSVPSVAFSANDLQHGGLGAIQKNHDFYANGKWRSQTAQGGRFVRLKFINSTMQLTLGPNGNNSLRVDGKCKKNEANLVVPSRKNSLKIIKDIIFIIKEHSQYSINHPENTDNILRHLKHTCHAIDSSLVKERPMPAGEESLIDILDGLQKEINNQNDLINEIKKVSSNSKDMCQKYLYSSEKSDKLIETARYINKKFEYLYNKINDQQL